MLVQTWRAKKQLLVSNNLLWFTVSKIHTYMYWLELKKKFKPQSTHGGLGERNRVKSVAVFVGLPHKSPRFRWNFGKRPDVQGKSPVFISLARLVEHVFQAFDKVQSVYAGQGVLPLLAVGQLNTNEKSEKQLPHGFCLSCLIKIWKKILIYIYLIYTLSIYNCIFQFSI